MRFEYVPDSKISMFKEHLPGDVYDELKNGGAFCIAAVENENAVGVIAAVIEQYICRLLWINVDSKRRREGIARLLLTELFSYTEVLPEIKELRCDMTLSDKSTPVCDMLIKLGFQPDTDYTSRRELCTLTYKKFYELPLMTKYKSRLKKIYSVRELQHTKYAYMIEQMCTELPFSWAEIRDGFNKVLSNLYISENTVKSMVLIRRISKRKIQISYLYVKAGSEISSIWLLIHMCEFCKNLLAPDTIIEMALIDESSVKLIRKLLPNAEFKNIFSLYMPIRA